ncbi:hypothetical protein INT44_001663 [Umbelopsis vinacea]|uniref:Uncharacterized protein n=1 Tax=Umbelopsis vinacea TaxID=44442 RepID=A0A8H7PR12_9FUNG|nr:hypothetical protein INT44_001663 [Umbelopsis vinacea]
MIPILAILLFSAVATKADLYSNGQYFGPGIIIIDAPAPNSTYQVNTTMPIAIDVSLDGKMNAPRNIMNLARTKSISSLLASGKITKDETVDRVSIFLTKPGFNLTVNNPLDLQSEPGSTVLHPNYLINSCVPAGNYNLSFYELDTINGSKVFSEIHIPVSVNTPAGWIQQPACQSSLQSPSSGSNSNIGTISSMAIANKCGLSTAAIIIFSICFLS